MPKFFRKFRGSIRLYLKQESGIRKIRTNYETTMIFTFEKLAKAYVLYRIKTKFVLKKKLKISRISLIFQKNCDYLISRIARCKLNFSQGLNFAIFPKSAKFNALKVVTNINEKFALNKSVRTKVPSDLR